MNDTEWGEELTASPIWEELVKEGVVPEQQGASSATFNKGTQTAVFDGANCFNQHREKILSWTSHDPGVHQRRYSESELNHDLFDFNAESGEESPGRNDFNNDEVVVDDYLSGTSIKSLEQSSKYGRNMYSCFIRSCRKRHYQHPIKQHSSKYSVYAG